MRVRQLATEIQVRFALRCHEQRAQFRARRDRRHEWLGWRRDLGVDDGLRLFDRALAKRHVALDARQLRSIVGHVEQMRLDLPPRRRRRR
jgi:hypothetical protein